MLITTALGLAALASASHGSVTSCYSCVQMTAGSNYPTYASAVKQIFGQWPQASRDCKSGPGSGEQTACNSFCVTQTFSVRVPGDSNGGASGIVRGCASTVLSGAAINPPQSVSRGQCAAHHVSPLANGVVIASVDTYPCATSNCNGGAPNTAALSCDNPCAHNTCPKGACAPAFDGVSYTCGGVAPTKVAPTSAPSSAGWAKAAAMFQSSIDPSVDPCVDFYAFSCNKWQQNHPIPPTRSSISNFGAIQANLLNTVGQQLQAPNNGSFGQWPQAIQTAHNLYQSCVNVNGANYKGSHFDNIIKQAGDWPILNETWSETQITLWQRSGILSRQFGVNTFITPSIDTDWKSPTKHALYLGQASLTYPAVYYTNPAYADIIRRNLKNMMLQAVINIGFANGRVIKADQIFGDVDAMIQLEFSIAQETVPPTKERQYLPLYNPYTVATASAKWPQIDWSIFLGTLLETGAQDPGRFIVTEPSFFTALNNQLAGIDSVSVKPVARMFQNYLVWRLVHSKADFLVYLLGMEGFRDAYRQAKREIENIEELPATPDIPCTNMVIGAMPYAAGRLYIDAHFNKLPNMPRAFIQKMTTSVMASFRQMIANLQWMDAVTKAKAITKVNNLLQNYAFPDWIMDDSKLNAWYASLVVKAGTIFWDANTNLINFQSAQMRAQLKAPVDRRNWGGTPAIVNAWYQPERNSITFPAGILNPPFFEADFPDAVNYGAMGIVEGHELTHGFDDQGVQWDGVGLLNPWIDAVSLAGFKAMAQCVIDEYHSFCYKFPNMTQFCVNGVQTQGEDIADNGGMKAAYLALKAAELLNGPQPRLPGPMAKYSNDQLFFMAFGQIWCENTKPASLRQQITLDPHAPARVRVIASIRNFPPFQQAFNCPANAPMSPTKHCTVW